MNWRQRGGSRQKAKARVPWAAALLLALSAAAGPMRAQEVAGDAGWRDVSLAEYRQHLGELDAVVADCEQQVTLKGAAPGKGDACDAKRVGPDDRVQWTAGSGSQVREVRYDWLRSILSSASKGGAAEPIFMGGLPAGKSKPVAVDELLKEARQRLETDAKQSENPAAANDNYADERKSLNAILAQEAYKGVAEVSAKDRFLEWFYMHLDEILAGLVRFGERSPWIAWALRLLLVGGIGAALLWLAMRLERGGRVKLVPDDARTPGSPSAREWQIWIKEAQAMAAESHWREAVHFVYWATIARLESRRLWPADRTRTPREYLALVGDGDEKKAGLTELTRRFERTWYGGREAADSDYRAALELARALGVGVE